MVRGTASGCAKAALSAKKARGFKLGTPASLTPNATLKAAAARRRYALEDPSNRRAAELALLYRERGLSYRAIAEKLAGSIALRDGSEELNQLTLERTNRRMTKTRVESWRNAKKKLKKKLKRRSERRASDSLLAKSSIAEITVPNVQMSPSLGLRFGWVTSHGKLISAGTFAESLILSELIALGLEVEVFIRPATADEEAVFLGTGTSIWVGHGYTKGRVEEGYRESKYLEIALSADRISQEISSPKNFAKNVIALVSDEMNPEREGGEDREEERRRPN